MLLKGWLANILVLLRQSTRRIARGAKRLRKTRRRQLPVGGQFCYTTSGEILESRIVLTPPTIDPQVFSVPENTANGTAIGTVAAADADVGDTQTFLITSGNTLGAFAISPSGIIRVADSRKLNFETIPTFNLTVRVTDSTGSFASNTVTINLTNVNEAPGISPQSFSLPENTANGVSVGSVIASDADAGDTKTFSITGGNSLGAFAISPAGLITVADTSKLNYEANQSFSLTVTVTDAGLLTASNTVTVNVTNVNEAPVIAPQSFNLAENSAVNSTVGAVVSSDPDANDTKSFAITGGNGLGAFTITRSGIIRVADSSHLDFETHPAFTLIVTVTDAAGLSASNTVTINLTDVNEAPVAVDGTLTTTEGSPASGTLVATDVDLDSLFYSILDFPEFGTVTITNTATGEYTYTPNEDYFGSDSFTFQANDGSLNSNLAIVSITIEPLNNSPVAEDGVLTTEEDTPAGGTLVATDIDSNSLVYIIETPAAFGTVIITNSATGAYVYTPGPDFNGEDTFTFKATDGLAYSNIASVFVTIEPVNDAPVAEDGTLVTDEDFAGHGSLEAIDIDSVDLEYFIVDQPQFGTVTITNPLTGDYTYTPNSNYHGSDYFLFQATDGSAISNVATVTVTVTSVNDAPMLNTIGDQIVDEETELTFTATASDHDDPAQTLTFSLVGAPAGASITAGGVFTWTPDESQGPGSYTFDVVVTDGSLTDSETITVTVNEVNVAPTIDPQSFSVAENTANGVTVGTVVANDVEGGSLTFTITGGNELGAFAISSGGVITVADATQLDFETTPTFTLTVRVTDAGGLFASNTVTIILTNENDPPVAQSQSITTNEDNPVSGQVVATDLELNPLTYLLVGGPANGNLTFNANGTFTYTPNANYYGADSFTFNANDGTSNSNVATVSITVNSVNDTPTIAPQTFTLAENTSTGATVGTVVANDVDSGDTQSFSITGGNSLGAFAISSSGVITVADYSKLDFETTPTFSLTISVTDGGGLIASNTITINLTDVNETPTIAPQTFSVEEKKDNGFVIGTVVASDPDAGDTKTFAITGGNNGAFAISSTGVLTVADTTKYDFATTPTFGLTVSVTDSVGHTTSTTVTIHVTEYVPILTGYQLQLGQVQKSFIRYIDLTFGSSYGLNTLLSAGAVKLSRQDLLTSKTDGVNNDLSPTLTPVSLTGLITVDNANKKLQIDFGAGGIGGIASSVTGDGYYTLELDLDRDGIFETTKHFYRLLGDGNGDRLVSTADAAFDLNGDGVVNSNDTTIATRSRGRRISSGLLVDANF